MSSFLVLKCENCGARLEFSERRDVYFCEHCGYKHLYEKIISGSVDESYAACPLCYRNDKVYKVTSLSNIPKPSKPIEVSGIFREQIKKKNYIWPLFLLIYGGLGVIGFIDWLFHPVFDFVNIFMIVITIICIFSGVRKIRATKEENEVIEERNHETELNWEFLKKRYETITPIYDRITELWNQLYYCNRDDIVYLPGMKEYTTKDNLLDFIEKQALGELNIK